MLLQKTKIAVAEDDLVKFAQVNRTQSGYFMVPIPNRKSFSDCPANHRNRSYWLAFETDTGMSGWCCSYCGLIHEVQGK